MTASTGYSCIVCTPTASEHCEDCQRIAAIIDRHIGPQIVAPTFKRDTLWDDLPKVALVRKRVDLLTGTLVALALFSGFCMAWTAWVRP